MSNNTNNKTGRKCSDSLVMEMSAKYNRAYLDWYIAVHSGDDKQNVKVLEAKLDVYQDVMSTILEISKEEVYEKFCKYKDTEELDRKVRLHIRTNKNLKYQRSDYNNDSSYVPRGC